MDKCENCKDFDGKRCHRYPQQQIKSKDDYCREFQRSQEKDKKE